MTAAEEFDGVGGDQATPGPSSQVLPDERLGVRLDEFSLPRDVDASRALGRAARDAAPLQTLGAWDPAARTETALDRLVAQHSVRLAELLPLRYARMSTSPWAYLRGAAAVMAADLATGSHTGLMVQMCGDAHVLNFGLWASPERRLLFDARDFDETLTGPFEWDMKRLCTSILVLADSEQVPLSIALTAVESAVNAYRDAMAGYAGMGELAIWYDAIDAQQLDSLLSVDQDDHTGTASTKRATKARKKARKRSNLGVLEQMTAEVDGRRVITDDPPKRVHLDPDLDRDRHALQQIVETFPPSVPVHQRRLLERFTPADVVRQVVGVGSVGMRVFLLYLEGQSGRQPLFLQVKQAAASVYEPFLAPSRFGNHGERVAVGQRLMQSATDIFLGYTRVDGYDYYVRQFRDAKIIPSGPAIAPVLVRFASACGQALAKSHARSGDPNAIAAYIGKGNTFREQLLAYARAYAKQTFADHTALVEAAEAGRVPVADEP